MYKPSKWIILLSSVLMLSLAWQPAAAKAAQPAGSGSTTLRLVINNQTGANVNLSLSGASSYYFTLGAGKTRVEVLKGKYQYRYLACEANQTGTLDVKKANQKLVLKKCPAAKKASSKAAKTVKVQMINQTGGSMTLMLSGPTSYRLTIPSGKSKIDVEKGKYTYTVYAVCGTKTGKINIRNRLRWSWWCYKGK